MSAIGSGDESAVSANKNDSRQALSGESLLDLYLAVDQDGQNSRPYWRGLAANMQERRRGPWHRGRSKSTEAA